MIPESYTLPAGKALALRVCDASLRGFSGFPWPDSGPVSAPDWDPSPQCGGGLHGWLWGEGDPRVAGNPPDGVWLLLEVDPGEGIDLGGKFKFPDVIVVASGPREEVISFLLRQPEARGRAVIYSTLTGGDYSTLTGGDESTLTGGDYSTLTGGDHSTLTGGNDSTLTGGDESTLTGGCYSTLTGGDESTLTGGDYSTLTGGYHSTLTGGDHSTLTGGNDSTLTGGDDSTLTGGCYSTLTGGDDSTLTGGYQSTLTGGDESTLTGGYPSTLTGGDHSILIFRYFQPTDTLSSLSSSVAVAVARVGDGGILPGVAYRVDRETGKIIPVEKESP